MKNKILLLTLIIFFSSIQIGYGEDLSSAEEVLGFLHRNPFKSWLPKIEEKIEKEPEATKIEYKEPEVKIIPVLKPAPVEEAKPPEIKISGLVWSTDRPQAIINDQILTIGDMIGDSKIIDINKDGVDIMFLNKLYTIKIEQTLTQSI
ncbi:MAG: hypothetical protein WCX16_03130 [Candidatus Omnitrophota bacterium]